MTAKKYAEDLRQKMYSFIAVEDGVQCALRAKFCAIISVKDTQSYLRNMWNANKIGDIAIFEIKFLDEVLIELEKL